MLQDIIYSMGVLSMGSKPVPLGLELAGVVQRIGANVSHVKPGDRIFGLATEGCFSTSAIMRSSLVSKIPDGLSFEDAATMPLCYSTAIQALINVGQTEAGQVRNDKPLQRPSSPNPFLTMYRQFLYIRHAEESVWQPYRLAR